jgi:hypothetical protein
MIHKVPSGLRKIGRPSIIGELKLGYEKKGVEEIEKSKGLVVCMKHVHRGKKWGENEMDYR